MFATMMKTLLYPHNRDNIACPGKGGQEGKRYMMERAREMLMAQGHDGDRSRIMMIGDRYDTDVRAGLSAGFKTCLVLTGCHSLECQNHYRADVAHFYADGVGDLVPQSAAASMPHLPPHSLPVNSENATSVADDPSAILEGWILSQSSGLLRGRAEKSRGTLQSALRSYFDAVDTDGSGTLDRDELLHACTSLGMGARPGSSSTMLTALQKAAGPGEEPLAVTFDEFCVVVEDALAECGVQARKRWKKLSLLKKATRGFGGLAAAAAATQ